MKRILIIEDDTLLSRSVTNWLLDASMESDCTTTIRDALLRLRKTDYDLVLSDLKLPDGSGIRILDWLNENYKNIPFVIMTKHGDIPSAVEAVKKGAFEYLQKPVYDIPLVETIQNALTGCPSCHKREVKIINRKSRAYQELVRRATLVANTDTSVLIRGESGAGKEHIAHILHDRSTRRDKPFIKVDCGAISKELAVSTFFGHLKGSFTGAIDNKTGLFHDAEGGTLFLDEIGNLPLEIQTVLLRVLQERQYKPLGSSQEIACNVRVIAATNEDIETAVDEGRFRFDLWQRLDEYPLEVPSLRECPEDVVPLAVELLKRFNAENNRHAEGFTEEAKEKLTAHEWPGNVRELMNAVRCAVIENMGGMIDADHLKFKAVPRKGAVLTLKDDEEERRKVEMAWEKSGHNHSKAAIMLGISRPTFYKKLEAYGLK